MTKTFCDICGKEMLKQVPRGLEAIEDMNFCISSHGRIWDICTECAEDINRWMTMRRAESEESNAVSN